MSERRVQITIMENGKQSETLAVFIMCRAHCHGGVLFSTNPDKKPDKVYMNKIPLELSMQLEGTQAKCGRCGMINKAIINYHSLPPMLVAVPADYDDNEGYLDT